MTNRMIRRLRRGIKGASDAVVGALAVALLKALRHTNPERMIDFAGRAMRTIGPLLPENRVGRESLTAAFPEKSPAEIEAILRGVWDNLGRVGAEFAHLDRLWDYKSPEQPGHFEIPQDSVARYSRIADAGEPALFFGAHLGNWELPAIAAAAYGAKSAVLYRGPNIPAVDRWISETRSALMGTLIRTGLDAPLRLAEAQRAGFHVGMLVDQYYVRGVPVTFFGRPTRANPLLARLARHLDSPIYGVRVIRLPGHRFRGDMTEAIEPVRDADGKINVAGTMQIITTVVEGWVREYPEQWLWLHRRWRPEDETPARTA
jgi:KDO2-lipid IV(A) lauroyltransferase